METLEEYTTKLGKFWVNFNSLELLLRLYLLKRNSEPEIGLELNMGDPCPLTHLTNYDSFQELARKYNDTVQPEDRISVGDVARLRDALAHGRVTTTTTVPMTVVKFARPDRASGATKVVFKQVLSADYLDKCAR